MDFEMMEYFKNLDRGIVTIAARPGDGKIDYTIDIVSIKHELNKKILYVSLEEPKEDAIIRIVSHNHGLPYYLVKQVDSSRNIMLIDYESNYDNLDVVDDIKSIDELDKFLLDNSYDFIFVDYIELLGNEYNKLIDIVSKYNCSIILVAQLNRENKLSDDLIKASDRVIYLYRDNNDIVSIESDNYKAMMKYNHENGKFDYYYGYRLYLLDSFESKIEFARENNLLNGIDSNDIEDLVDDYDGKAYILLKNGDLYVDGKLEEQDIKMISFQDASSIFAISNDNRVIPFFDRPVAEHMSNNNEPYKKIITTPLSLVCLTNEGTINFMTTMPGVSVDYKDLIDVKDIDYVESDDLVIITHDMKNYENLFIE